MSFEIEVLMASDAGFVMQLGVAVASVARQHPDGGVRVTVLCKGINAHDRERVEAAAGALEVLWIEVDERVLDGVNMPAHLPVSSAYRIIGPDLLPSDVRRFVYLDADILVRRPLSALMERDLQGHAVGAVRDVCIPWVAMLSGLPWREAGVPPDLPYFNAGVMVVDRVTWNQQAVSRRALACLRDYQLPLADQCALNLSLGGSWTEVPVTWNTQSFLFCPPDRPVAELVWPAEELESARTDPALLHFCHGTCGRPWLWCVHPFAGEWHEVRASTPWAEWKRTRATRTDRLRGLGRRLRRAADTLRHG